VVSVGTVVTVDGIAVSAGTTVTVGGIKVAVGIVVPVVERSALQA
jgi:hypothetical protein